MNKAAKVLGIAGVAAGSAAAGYMMSEMMKKARKKNIAECVQKMILQHPEEDGIDVFLDEEMGNDACQRYADKQARRSVFGEKKVLLPGEKKYLDLILNEIRESAIMIRDRLDSIDRVTRTMNMSCTEKCEKIRALNGDAHKNSQNISRAVEDLFKVLRKEFCGDYCDYINIKIAESERMGFENE